MSDIEEKIAALDRLRKVMGDAWVDAQIAELRAGQPAPVQMELKTEDHAQARSNRQIYNAPGATYHEAPPDRAASRAERALNDYLSSMVGACRVLQLGLLDPSDTRSRAMNLDQVYVGLRVEREIAEPEVEPPDVPQPQLRTWLRMLGRLLRRQRDSEAQRMTRDGERPRRRLTAIEALLQAPACRLMLLGPPGSGKSTFVNHLLLCLAEAALAERVGDTPLCDEWIGRLPYWNADVRLPIRIILRDLAAHPPPGPATAPLAWLQDFLRATLGEPLEDALELLLDALSAGRAVLLFDGLDEVVGDSAIDSVVQAIRAAAATYRRSPLLVTCRVRDFQENPRRQIAGLAIETLAPFDNDQIELFVDAWYAELAAMGRTVLGTAAGLREAITNRAEIRRLAESPLLLTMTAVVHAGKGTLPDARALLYAECVDLLLLRWRQQPGRPDVLDRLNLPEFRANDLLALMAELGFAAHDGAERSAENSDEPADLALAEVERILRRAFEPYAVSNPVRRDELASILLHEIAGRNGLLLKRSAERGEAYAFPHRTFQEFLAGYYLKSRPNPVAQWLERAAQPHWHEALTLMIGYQVLKDEEFERPLAFVRQLLDRSPLEQALAGELLNQIGRERAARYDPSLVTAQGLWGDVRRALGQLALAGQAPDAPFDLRVRAGQALGMLCYGSIEALRTPGARPPLPVSHLPLAVVGPQAAALDTWRKALNHYWRVVRPGAFWFGDDRKDALQQVHLPYGFAIGRYPITNAEFARFVASGGYDPQQPWWTGHGRDFIRQRSLSAPRFWDAPRYNNPLQPVVGVSWYEATAYCRWLTAQGHAQGWLDPTHTIRLPTSLEWERAARGTDRRRFPWGDEAPTPEHANYDATRIGVPTPIGCFPRGMSPCGALDMAGNVMEWLATPYQQDRQFEAEKDFTPERGVLLTRGSFWDKGEHLCCGARYRFYPDFWYYYLGIRVILSLARAE